MLYNKDTYCYTQNYNLNPYNSIANYNLGPLAHKDMAQQEPMSNMLDNFASTNSTIDGDSPLAESEVSVSPDGTRAPANRRDPIYTAVPGLKWKSKSKKWVVRWDNPITNRRVYKYFSGHRYGFIGAHKRAAYYLEFLNASVGKGALSSGENPFCRRNEGPPKGKSNKGLQRKYKQGSHFRNVSSNKSDYQHSNSGNLIMKNNNINDMSCGMMEILSVDNLSNQLVNDVNYMHQNNNHDNIDKRHYTDYSEMYNVDYQNMHLSEAQANIADMGMLSYPTYVYNPQNYLNQFTDYNEDRFYQPLTYQDQIIHPNTQYDGSANDSQLVEGQVKFDPNNCKQQPNDYINYSTPDCQNFEHEIPNYNNLDYYSLDDLNNKSTNDLMQNISGNWNSRCDDGIRNNNNNNNNGNYKMHNNPEYNSKRGNCNEYGTNWKIHKRN